VIAASKDGNTYIFDITTRQILQKLTFKIENGNKHMGPRGCFFSRAMEAYTLNTAPRGPSFLIKWEMVQE
jgi:hypothetical protein